MHCIYSNNYYYDSKSKAQSEKLGLLGIEKLGWISKQSQEVRCQQGEYIYLSVSIIQTVDCVMADCGSSDYQCGQIHFPVYIPMFPILYTLSLCMLAK